MLIGVILLALPCLVASTCDVTCSKKTQLVKEGQCVCSPRYGGYYKKGDFCTVRLTLNKNTRVRLKPEVFRMRYGGQCSRDALKFENLYNKNKNDGYWMKTICKKDQMHGDPKSIIINSPQVRMKFRADKKGESTKNRKWKLCLNPKRNPEIKSADSCNSTMTGFVQGFNKRTFGLDNNETVFVTKVCCKSMDLADVDQAKMMCVDDAGEESIVTKITSNGNLVCIYCNHMKHAAHVEVDVVNKVDAKKVTCGCTIDSGVAINDDCTGDLPCLDTNDLATCDSGNTNLCVCPSGYVVSFDGGYCTTESQLTEDCSNGENCVSKYDRAECNGTVCSCPAGFDSADLGGDARCTQVVAIGEDCSGELTCSDINNRATCDAGTNLCTCPSGTVPDPSNTFCTHDSNYKGECEFDNDCTQSRSQTCDTGTSKCICESPFVEYNGKCSYNSNLNGDCDSTSIDCVVANSACTGGVCKCKSNDYKASGTTACNAVCLMKNGKQIDKGKKVCNKRFKSGTCFLCECNKPVKAMKELNKKASCGKIGTCSKSSTIKASVMKGSNCGE